MKFSSIILFLSVLSLGLSRSALAADAPAPAAAPVPAKPGYSVVVDIQIDEKGAAEDVKLVSSDDTTLDHILERTSLQMGMQLKQPPRVKEGKPVKFTVRAPFIFSVEGDEGPEPENLKKPKILKAEQPVYPAALQAKGEVGGAILEIVIGLDGLISDLKVLRSTHPEFAQAATEAVKQWSFRPAFLDGTAVSSRWRLSLCFETDVRSIDWKWRVAPRPSLGNYTIIHRTQPATETPAAETPAATPPKPAEPTPAGK